VGRRNGLRGPLPLDATAGVDGAVVVGSPTNGSALLSLDGRAGAASGTARGSARAALVTRALLAADVLALLGAGLVALAIARPTSAAPWLLIGIAVPTWLAGAHLRGLYVQDSRRLEHSTLDELGPIVQLATLGTWLAVMLLWLSTGTVAAAPAVAFWAASLVFVVSARSVGRALIRRRRAFVQKAVIVGAGEVGQLVARKLAHNPKHGICVVGLVDARPRPLRKEIADVPVLGSPSEIREIVREHDVDRVIVAYWQDGHDAVVKLLRTLRPLGVEVDLVPRMFEALGPAASVHYVEGLPLLGLQTRAATRLERAVKRAQDLVLASSVLLVSAPLLAWIAWRIKRDSPGPVLFRQVRLGEAQRQFTMLKFRTMTVGTNDAPHRAYIREIMDTAAVPVSNNLYKLERADDVTRVGAWLRRTSLDELPQLINVIRGDMSLVGPRPCIPYEVELFEPHHLDRFTVPAGMTGLWQVTARARATFKEALDLDAAYAQSWSLRLDASLLARTALALIRDKATT
jgi:exopolysaccharide biosynthesis polyprenyl glycosylphosphotransferase